MKRIQLSLLGVIAYAFLAAVGNVNAVSAGPAKIWTNPAAYSFTDNNQTKVNVIINAASEPASLVTFRLKFSPYNNDLEALELVPNEKLISQGWSFPVRQIHTDNGTVNIDLAAANINPEGGRLPADTLLATVTFRANSSFSAKQIDFDPQQTIVYRKTDKTDILGSAVGLTATTQTGTGGTDPSAASPVASPVSGGFSAFLTSPRASLPATYVRPSAAASAGSAGWPVFNKPASVTPTASAGGLRSASPAAAPPSPDTKLIAASKMVNLIRSVLPWVVGALMAVFAFKFILKFLRQPPQDKEPPVMPPTPPTPPQV